MTATRLVPIASRIGMPKCSARMGASTYAAADSGDGAQHPRKKTKDNQKNSYHVAHDLRLAALRRRRSAGSRGQHRTMEMFRKFAARGNMSGSGYHSRRTRRFRLLVGVVAGAHHRS